MEWPDWMQFSAESLNFQPLSDITQEFVQTRIHSFDINFEGLAIGQIYEVCGEAGCGKTNLALQISKNLSETCKVLYISTQKPLSQSRLNSIGLNFSNFHEIYSPTPSQTIRLIREELPLIIQSNHIKFLVLDNIYSFVTHEEVPDIKTRTSLIQRFSIIIKHLSVTHNFAVLVVNNVVSDMNKSVNPGLGLTWSYCVNHRIFITKLQEQRICKVLYSNCVRKDLKFTMEISNDGVSLREMMED